ncbi:hypothetical protein D3C76_1243000 [compost metagenome]
MFGLEEEFQAIAIGVVEIHAVADLVVGDLHHLDALLQQHAVELAQGGHVARDLQPVVLQPQAALVGPGCRAQQRDVVVLGTEGHHDPAFTPGAFMHAQHVGVPTRRHFRVAHG